MPPNPWNSRAVPPSTQFNWESPQYRLPILAEAIHRMNMCPASAHPTLALCYPTRCIRTHVSPFCNLLLALQTYPVYWPRMIVSLRIRPCCSLSAPKTMQDHLLRSTSCGSLLSTLSCNVSDLLPLDFGHARLLSAKVEQPYSRSLPSEC